MISCSAATSGWSTPLLTIAAFFFGLGSPQIFAIRADLIEYYLAFLVTGAVLVLGSFFLRYCGAARGAGALGLALF